MFAILTENYFLSPIMANINILRLEIPKNVIQFLINVK
jgi:hypothetical protein